MEALEETVGIFVEYIVPECDAGSDGVLRIFYCRLRKYTLHR